MHIGPVNHLFHFFHFRIGYQTRREAEGGEEAGDAGVAAVGVAQGVEIATEEDAEYCPVKRVGHYYRGLAEHGEPLPDCQF